MPRTHPAVLFRIPNEKQQAMGMQPRMKAWVRIAGPNPLRGCVPQACVGDLATLIFW